MTTEFNGLGLHLGNLSRLSRAKTRSISPENFTGEKGKGGMATEGTGAIHARGPRPGLEDLALGSHRVRRDLHPRRHRGRRRDPADLDDPGQCALAHSASCASTGTTRNSLRWRCRSATSSPVAGTNMRRSLRSPSASILAAPSTATGRCRSASRARFTLENLRPGRPRDRLLPDQLHADRGAGGRRLFPRAVPACQSARLQGRLHHSRRRVGPRSLRRHLHGLGGRTTPAGGARARSSSSSTAIAISRRSAAPARRTTSAAPTISTSGVIDPTRSAYREFSTAYAGLPQVIRPDGMYRSQQRFGMYRWHIMDPIRFESDLQRHHPGARLARRSKDRRYLPLQDDIASVAYWYQTLPTARFPPLPDRDYLEVI